MPGATLTLNRRADPDISLTELPHDDHLDAYGELNPALTAASDGY